jgi:hypothetical protein
MQTETTFLKIRDDLEAVKRSVNLCTFDDYVLDTTAVLAVRYGSNSCELVVVKFNWKLILTNFQPRQNKPKLLYSYYI